MKWNARDASNPDYMKNDFNNFIDTWHKEGIRDIDSVHELKQKELQKREIVDIESPHTGEEFIETTSISFPPPKGLISG